MTVELKPETERLLCEELRSGHFQTSDDVIIHFVYALREKLMHAQPVNAPRKPRKNLADFLLESPFAGSELNLDRQTDYGRHIDL